MATTNRWPALLVLCAGTLMIILDGSIVAVALPAIQRDLGFTASGLAWVVNAYLVAFGAWPSRPGEAPWPSRPPGRRAEPSPGRRVQSRRPALPSTSASVSTAAG